ncbi:hypothetical protein B7463_g12224, partial [Scytalidium lignicola]
MPKQFADNCLAGDRLEETMSNNELPDLNDMFDFDEASQEPEGSRDTTTSRQSSRVLTPGLRKTQLSSDANVLTSCGLGINRAKVLTDDDNDDGLFTTDLSDETTELDEELVDEEDDAILTQEKTWRNQKPAFHALDYESNIEIEVTKEVQSLARETRLRSAEDSDDNSDADSALDEESLAGHNADDREDDREDDRVDDRVEEQVEEQVDSQPGLPCNREAQDDWPLNLSSTQDNLYSDSLKQLTITPEKKYDLNNISSISYALAVDPHCLDSSDPEQDSAWCLLADRNTVQEEYKSSSRQAGMTFYPLAFHPRYSNFSSPGPLRFLQDHVFAVMKENMSYQNNRAAVLSCDFFQGYSNTKRSIRYNPEDLLVTQGIATAALSLPDSEAKRSAQVKATQQRLLRRLQGKSTPEDPDASQPFACERQQIQHAIEQNKFAFRIEQADLAAHVLLSSGDRALHTTATVLLSHGGAWPYIDPRMLDLRLGEGHLDTVRWPRRSDGRPIFMHVASLSFHYGPEVAASQHSLVWFRDLGGKSIWDPVVGTHFLSKVLQDLWILQMVAYVRHQVLQQLSLAGSSKEDVVLDPNATLDAAPDDLAKH